MSDSDSKLDDVPTLADEALPATEEVRAVEGLSPLAEALAAEESLDAGEEALASEEVPLVAEEPTAAEEPPVVPDPEPLKPLPSHRVDFVPEDFDLEALRAAAPDLHLALSVREEPFARFDELRLSPAEVNALLGLGVRLVLMPHLPLPADILIADMHAHEHADPHEAVLLKVPEDSHPELIERVAAENANRELVAASNREQARIAAENQAREEAKRAAEKKN